MKNKKRIVYSTEHGNLCPECGEKKHTGPCDNNEIIGDGRVRIQRETKGRKGAGVTLIKGIPLPPTELKTLHKDLKKKCGVGGAVKNGVLEFQGDQRQTLLKLLEPYDWDVKIAGG